MLLATLIITLIHAVHVAADSGIQNILAQEGDASRTVGLFSFRYDMKFFLHHAMLVTTGSDERIRPLTDR